MSKHDKDLMVLNLKNPDEVVKFIIAFYAKNSVKSEKDLVKQLEKHKPLIKVMQLQGQHVK